MTCSETFRQVHGPAELAPGDLVEAQAGTEVLRGRVARTQSTPSRLWIIEEASESLLEIGDRYALWLVEPDRSG